MTGMMPLPWARSACTASYRSRVRLTSAESSNR